MTYTLIATNTLDACIRVCSPPSVPGPLGTAAPRGPSLSTDQRLSRTPRPARMVCPGLGAVAPRRPSLSTDQRVGTAARPPGLCAWAIGNCCPPQALLEHRHPLFCTGDFQECQNRGRVCPTACCPRCHCLIPLFRTLLCFGRMMHPVLSQVSK